MKEKICLVTGATSGIGEAAALELARHGATVVIVGRNPEKCSATIERIKRETGSLKVESFLADLSIMSQVRTLATNFLEKFERLDVLVNNAGGFFWHRQDTPDGYEKTFALNHLSYFLLTLSLLDILKASAPARIINVASDSHRGQRLDFDDLNSSSTYNPLKAYGRSKLANILFTYELARRLAETGVTVNAVHPGFVATNIWQEPKSWLMPMVRLFVRLIAISPEKGAETIIYLATSKEVSGTTSHYFVSKKPVRSDPSSYDIEAGRKLWQISLEMTASKNTVNSDLSPDLES